MDYIQRKLATATKDKKNWLYIKYNELKSSIIEHCRHEILTGFIDASVDGDLLKLRFPDLDYGIYGKPRIAFDDSLTPGLRVNFYDDQNEWSMSLVLTQQGFCTIETKNGGSYSQYEHDDEKLPMVIIHALLSSAHQSGRIAL